MNRSQLAWVEADDRDGFRVVRVRGEIDLSNADEVSAGIGEALTSESGDVVVDLGAVTFMDSSGIAMLLRLALHLRDLERQLRVVVPTDSPIRRVLQLTRVDHFIHIDDVLNPPATT